MSDEEEGGEEPEKRPPSPHALAEAARRRTLERPDGGQVRPPWIVAGRGKVADRR